MYMMLVGYPATTSNEWYSCSTETKRLHAIFPPQHLVLLLVSWIGSTRIFIKGRSLITPWLYHHNFPFYCQVESEYAAGRMQEAIIASQTAKKLNIISVVVGVTVNLMAIICIFIIVIVSTSEEDDWTITLCS